MLIEDLVHLSIFYFNFRKRYTGVFTESLTTTLICNNEAIMAQNPRLMANKMS